MKSLRGFGKEEYERYVLAGALRMIEADCHVAALLRQNGLMSPPAHDVYKKRVEMCAHRSFAGALAHVVRSGHDGHLEPIIPDLADIRHAVEERVMAAADFAQVIALKGQQKRILDTYDTIKLRTGPNDVGQHMRTYRDAEEQITSVNDNMHRDLAAKRAVLLRHLPDFLHDTRYATIAEVITSRLSEGRYVEAFDASTDAGSREFFSALSIADEFYRNHALTEDEYIMVVRKYRPYIAIHRVHDPERRAALEHRFRATDAMRADLVTGRLGPREYALLCEGIRHVGADGVTNMPAEFVSEARSKIAVLIRGHFNKYTM